MAPTKPAAVSMLVGVWGCWGYNLWRGEAWRPLTAAALISTVFIAALAYAFTCSEEEG